MKLRISISRGVWSIRSHIFNHYILQLSSQKKWRIEKNLTWSDGGISPIWLLLWVDQNYINLFGCVIRSLFLTEIVLKFLVVTFETSSWKSNKNSWLMRLNHVYEWKSNRPWVLIISFSLSQINLSNKLDFNLITFLLPKFIVLSWSRCFGNYLLIESTSLNFYGLLYYNN